MSESVPDKPTADELWNACAEVLAAKDGPLPIRQVVDATGLSSGEITSMLIRETGNRPEAYVKFRFPPIPEAAILSMHSRDKPNAQKFMDTIKPSSSNLFDFPRLRLRRTSSDGSTYWQATLAYAPDDQESRDIECETLDEAVSICLKKFKDTITDVGAERPNPGSKITHIFDVTLHPDIKL